MWRIVLIIVGLGIPELNAEGDEEWREVTISQGPIRGRKETDGVYAFYSIPYATAPTGTDKFKPPLPPPQWTEPLEAINKKIVCPQADFKLEESQSRIIQEDCLIANVYVPDTDNRNLSVVLFIHGGGYHAGYGDFLQPKKLMKMKDMITISFNYRLGIHGFLCLGTKDVPGNAGMKDIVAMLRWVKQNIDNFGGNPDDVTISGFSAGAAAADLLILSKSTNGLFKKVIIESGSNLAAFAVQTDPLEIAKTYAMSQNFTDVGDIYALEKFYKTASHDILNPDNLFWRKDSTFLYAPCVERDTGVEVFLDAAPIDILKKGSYTKVPMLYGFASMEGILRIDLFDDWKSAMNDKFSEFLPPDLEFENEEQKEDIAAKVKNFYFGDNEIDEGSILGYVDFFTDITFAYPALLSVRLNVESKNNQMYLYQYSFVDENVPFVPHTKVRGATHCSQTAAIFDDFQPMNETLEYSNIRKLMREMWANFITTGEPVPEGSSLPVAWPPTTVNRTTYMSFGQAVEMGSALLEERVRFWDGIYEKYYRKPAPPPAPPVK